MTQKITLEFQTSSLETEVNFEVHGKNLKTNKGTTGFFGINILKKTEVTER